ncbi:MAG: DUF2273 domain-containing protein [Selenomonadaceae bacterium]|nr:DUF2273 domain-containing protein [Selenomonadaceae bacterium]MBR1859335.1 DUF2273 domain-containing protein [Selenomonadaceae bacterium]
MWTDLKTYAAVFFETHRTRKIGFIVGLILGIAILIFGFFNTLFVFIFGFIGLYTGAKFDNGDDLIDETLKKLDRILPERFRRW